MKTICFYTNSSVRKFKKYWMKYGMFPTEVFDAIVENSSIKDTYNWSLYSYNTRAKAPHIVVQGKHEAMSILNSVARACNGQLMFYKKVGYRWVDFMNNTSSREIYEESIDSYSYERMSRLYVAYYHFTHNGNVYCFGIGMTGCLYGCGLTDHDARTSTHEISKLTFDKISVSADTDIEQFIDRCRNRVHARSTGESYYTFEPDDYHFEFED